MLQQILQGFIECRAVTIAVYGEITVQIHAEDAKNGFCINNNAVVKMSISKSTFGSCFYKLLYFLSSIESYYAV